MGDCLLVLSKGELFCALASSHKILGVWPYDSLRRYYCVEDMFGFVAGRRSPRGEGEFKFVSKEKEDIYHRLERAILRAKRGSAGSTSSAEGSKDVDNRPPAPLPTEEHYLSTPARKETPVPTSESDEEIFQSDPNSGPLSPSSGGMKRLVRDQVASEISPAYGKFNGSGGGAGGRSGRGQVTVWLHESVSAVPQPQESSKPSPRKQQQQSPEVAATAKRPPLPPSRNSHVTVASEEDTYSHTIHRVPEQFQKKAMEHNVIGGNIYNALVHQQSSPSLTGRSSRPSSEADTNLYDVAFPQGRRVIATGDYAVARHPDTPQYPAGAPKLPPRRMATAPHLIVGRESTDGGDSLQSQEVKKPPVPRAASSSPVHEAKGGGKAGEEDDDGLTVNPLYGSQDQLLNDLAILEEQIRDMELDQIGSPTIGGAQSSNTTSVAAALPDDSEDLDEADQQFTVNPIYGDLSSAQKQKAAERSRVSNNNMAARIEGGVASERVSKDKEESVKPMDNSLLSESEQSVAQATQKEKVPSPLSAEEPSSAAASDGGIQRDAKGYSKVDKSKKVNSCVSEPVETGDGGRKEEEGSEAMAVPSLVSQGSVDTDASPPPLPERNYSFDESELNRPPTAAGRGQGEDS